MDEQDAIVKALRKIKQYQVEGRDFDEVRYVFDWDESRPNNGTLLVLSEIKALRYLEAAGAITLRTKANFYMSQYEEAQRKHGSDVAVWDGWNTYFDGAQKHFSELYYIKSLDQDHFQAEVKKFGLVDTGLALATLETVNEKQSRTIYNKPEPSYEPATGAFRYNGDRYFPFTGLDAKLFDALWDSRHVILNTVPDDEAEPVPWKDLAFGNGVGNKTVSARVSKLRETIKQARLPITIEKPPRSGNYQLVINLTNSKP